MMKKALTTLGVVILSGCGALKNMEEMKKTTTGMAETTTKMESGMNDSMMGLRTAIGYDVNVKSLKELMNATTMTEKIIHARVYLNAFEFQGWTGANFDNAKNRDELFRQAINKLYADFKEIVGPIENIQQLPITSGTVTDDIENRANSALAIAMSLHEINAHQKEFAHKRHFEPKSMLHLISEGLAAYMAEKAGKGSAETAPAYIKATMVKENVEVAKTMLQVRYNGLTMKLVTMISPLGNDSLPMKEKLVSTLQMVRNVWGVDYSLLDSSATAERATLMSAFAIQTKQMLNQLGVPLPTVQLFSNPTTAGTYRGFVKKMFDTDLSVMPTFTSIIENMEAGTVIPKGLPYASLAEKLKKDLGTIQSFYKK